MGKIVKSGRSENEAPMCSFKCGGMFNIHRVMGSRFIMSSRKVRGQMKEGTYGYQYKTRNKSIVFSLERLYTLDKVFSFSPPPSARACVSWRGCEKEENGLFLSFELPIYQSRLISIVTKPIMIIVTTSMTKQHNTL